MNKEAVALYNKKWRLNNPNYQKNYKKGIRLLSNANQSEKDKYKNRLIKYRIINKETNCWEWTGRIARSGYGIIQIVKEKNNPKKLSVHRFAIEIFTNNILNDSDVINHMCHNRKCFNPEHLQITTHKINMIRKNTDWELFANEHKELIDRFNSVDKELKNTYRNWHIKMQLKLF